MNNIDKQGTWLAVALLTYFVMAGSTYAASFDCAKAATNVEKLICEDPKLSKLDEDVSVAYKTALQDTKQGAAIRQAQKQWLKTRDDCHDSTCLTQSYQQRLGELQIAISETPDTSRHGVNDDSSEGQQYHFRITKGKGVRVCDAYLERLNTTAYVKPPFCDRPENDAVKGFTKLNRIPLSPADVHDLIPIVSTFMLLANKKDIDWTDMAFQRGLTEHDHPKPSPSGSGMLQLFLDGGSAKMWRYAPPVDIDNDGTPDNIEIWHGSALPKGVGGRQCGDDSPANFPGNSVIRQPQVALVISGNNNRLDAVTTERIFGHPKGGYPIHLDGQLAVSGDFRPIGTSIGIFEYLGLYYFDTFFDSWGDFENRRQRDKNIFNTLAVFQNKDGKTREVCEYLMIETASEKGKGAK